MSGPCLGSSPLIALEQTPSSEVRVKGMKTLELASCVAYSDLFPLWDLLHPWVDQAVWP